MRATLHDQEVEVSAETDDELVELNAWYNSIGRALHGPEGFAKALRFTTEMIVTKKEGRMLAVSLQFEAKAVKA